jgi:hypothetical protein
MIDKTKIKPGTQLVHKMLGSVVYTEQCEALELITGNSSCDGPFGSLFVKHNGDIKEVTLSLLHEDTK